MGKKTKFKASKRKEAPALIKINRELYEAIRIIVRKNPVEYPTMKHFVEKAAMNLVGSRKYDIQGIKTDDASLEQPLREAVKNANKTPVNCIICNKSLYKQEGSKAKDVCLECRKAISHLSKVIGGE